ncbi:OmpP1/FadL family transporter [Neisseriaceae bacterium TC5R-5]|nr:OmpP1/FadL family transporter [Neisseriaceae bacterium TC5R-5]
MLLKPLNLSLLVIGAACGLSPLPLMAAGYQFGSQSVAGQGTAHANGAEANDPSTIFTNPAGLSRLDGTQFSGGLTLVVPHSDYTDHGSTNILGQPTGGSDGGRFAPRVVAAPSLYLSSKINNQINVGLGVFVPYGAKLDYGFDWTGRYALKSINLQTININPSMSFKLNEQHSFGFGVSAQYMDANLQQMADATSGLRLKLGPLVGPGVSGDGLAEIKGDDWGFGWNIGYLFELNKGTRFGLAYRSSIKQSLTGTSTWTFNNVTGNIVVPAIPGVTLPPGTYPASALAKGNHPNASSTVDVTTPESFSANAFHQLNSKWALMGDLTWTGHSKLDKIDIQQSTVNGVAQGDMVIHQNWRDTWRVSLGANYQYSDAWLLRGGLAWEQSPVRSDDDRHPAIPDANRLWLSAGANYKLTKNSSLDLAYSFINFTNASTNYTDGCSPVGVSPTTKASCTGNGGTVRGSYKTYLQLLGVQYNHRF